MKKGLKNIFRCIFLNYSHMQYFVRSKMPYMPTYVIYYQEKKVNNNFQKLIKVNNMFFKYLK